MYLVWLLYLIFFAFQLKVVLRVRRYRLWLFWVVLDKHCCLLFFFCVILGGCVQLLRFIQWRFTGLLTLLQKYAKLLLSRCLLFDLLHCTIGSWFSADELPLGGGQGVITFKELALTCNTALESVVGELPLRSCQGFLRAHLQSLHGSNLLWSC